MYVCALTTQHSTLHHHTTHSTLHKQTTKHTLHNNTLHIIQIFIIFYRGADIYAKDALGCTPMMNAIAHGHKEVVKVFFNFDYTADIVVKRDKMLIEWAIEQGHLCLVEVNTEDVGHV